MQDRYFATARNDILPYVPGAVSRVLDVGCGTGATVALLRQQHRLEWTGGVEIHGPSAAEAEKVLDRVWASAIEDADLESEIAGNSLDLVLCLDVLEHLVDPWNAVKRLSALLKPGGAMLISLPNVRNWKFIKNLLFKGDFRYRDAGLLDRTHLRFFVRDTAIELATSGGLQLATCADATSYAATDIRRLLVKASGGHLSDLIAKQYVIVAKKA
jgi:2-polyprenyl-3-methyl-5-hydroxy-6-metoxy-1,4-benzoquinol methylase